MNWAVRSIQVELLRMYRYLSGFGVASRLFKFMLRLKLADVPFS